MTEKKAAIVVEAVMHLNKTAGTSSPADESKDSGGAAIKVLQKQVDEMHGMLKALVLDGKLGDAGGRDTAKAIGGMTSMPKDGKCCYHAAGTALAMQRGANPAKLNNEGDTSMMVEAKKHILENMETINKDLKHESQNRVGWFINCR